jgi:hypothetical protein
MASFPESLNPKIYQIDSRPPHGRGCYATSSFPTDTIILHAENPTVHVIHKRYKKEVCAWCFRYDDGRIWPLSHSYTHASLPKDPIKLAWFCTQSCQQHWEENTSKMVLVAMAELELFSRQLSRFKNPDEVKIDVKGPETEPRAQEKWKEIEPSASSIRSIRRSAVTSKAERKILKEELDTLLRDPYIDLDLASFFIWTALLPIEALEKWNDMLVLHPSWIAYTEKDIGAQLLRIHINVYRLLNLILPPPLLESFTQEAFLALALRDPTNSFGTRSDTGDEFLGYGMWTEASFFNHSCEPNVGKTNEGRGWVFRAQRDVTEGEELCISYLGSGKDLLDMSLLERRERLRSTWGFLCDCRRCTREDSEKR